MYVTVPARGANCSCPVSDTARKIVLQSPQGARIVAICEYEYAEVTVTVPARGANCSKKKEEKENSEKLQSPQGARIVAACFFIQLLRLVCYSPRKGREL